MPNWNRFAVIALVWIAAIPVPGIAEERNLPPWQQLTDSQRALWHDIVAPVFAEADIAQDLEPEEYYCILSRLGRNSPTPDRETTEAVHLKRFLELKIASNLFRRQVQSAIEEPSTDTLRQWTETRPTLFVKSDRVDLHSIYIRRFSDESTPSARRRAEAAWKMLQDGAHFKEVAMWFSDARSAGLGGSAGTVNREAVAPDIGDVIFNLEEGETTGPLERNNGYYIFRVSTRRPGFTLERPENAAQARGLWIVQETQKRILEAVDRWVEANKPAVRREPDAVSDWISETWIEHTTGKAEPFGLVYCDVAHRNLNTTHPGLWSTAWSEEAEAFASSVKIGLASFSKVRNAPEFAPALEMAIQAYAGFDSLREWFSRLQPTESQLQEYYTANATRLFPSLPRATFFLWHIPVPRKDGETEREHAPRLQAMLNRVYAAVKGDSPTTESAARALFERLKGEFPDSKWEKMTDIESISPFIDPILIRTDSRTLSRPFDSGSGVGLVFMFERRFESPTLEQTRDAIIYHWRAEQLRQFLQKTLESDRLIPVEAVTKRPMLPNAGKTMQ